MAFLWGVRSKKDLSTTCYSCSMLQAYDGASHSNSWDAQQQLLQQAQQAAQLQQLQQAQVQLAAEAQIQSVLCCSVPTNAPCSSSLPQPCKPVLVCTLPKPAECHTAFRPFEQAQLYARGSSGSAEWPAGSEELQAATWRRNTHSLPALRENLVVADSGSSGASSGRPSVDYTQASSIHPAKVQHWIKAWEGTSLLQQLDALPAMLDRIWLFSRMCTQASVL